MNPSPIIGLVERELLAAEYDHDGWKAKAREMRDPGYEVSNDEARALRAITAALSLPTPTVDREAIARAIDPDAWEKRLFEYRRSRRDLALLQADRVTGLLHPIDDIGSAGADWVDDISHAGAEVEAVDGRRLTPEPALSPSATEPVPVSAHPGNGQAQEDI